MAAALRIIPTRDHSNQQIQCEDHDDSMVIPRDARNPNKRIYLTTAEWQGNPNPNPNPN